MEKKDIKKEAGTSSAVINHIKELYKNGLSIDEIYKKLYWMDKTIINQALEIKQSVKKQADVEPTEMVDIPEGDTTPDDIMGDGDEEGADFIGGGDMGGGDGMGFADELGEGGPMEGQPPQGPQIDWNEVEIFPTHNLDNIIEDQEDFEIDFSRLV